MTPTLALWLDRLGGLTAREALQVTSQLAAFRTASGFSLSEICEVQGHAGLAALAYVTLHEQDVRRVTVHARPHPLALDRAARLLNPRGQLAARQWRQAPAVLLGEPFDHRHWSPLPSPADFRPLLPLMPGQLTWESLTAHQLRLLDPLGCWTVQFECLRPGQAVVLTVPYRDAEALGYTLGLEPTTPTPVWHPQVSRADVLRAAGEWTPSGRSSDV